MIIKRIKNIISSKVIRNASWLGSSELVNRVFRIATGIVLSRLLDPKEYGSMAILYVFYEFSFVFIRSGIVAKIIQAEEQELQSICDTSYWINWITCIIAFLTQCSLAYPVSIFFENHQLFLPLCLSSITYLIFPFFLVKSALIEREHRMKEIAFINVVAGIISNLIIVILVVLGLGIWSISIAMVLSTFVWLMVNLRPLHWKTPHTISLTQSHTVINFSKKVLGIELLSKLRNNLDFIIVGKILGTANLGLYFFAFNNGSGITTNVANTFIWALFPHLCSIRQDREKFKFEYFKNTKIIISTIATIVLVQSSLSYFYVPIIFGEKWVPSIPVLIMICLAVIPMSLKMLASLLMNAEDKPHLTLSFDIIYTFVFAVSVLIGVNYGIYGVAGAVMLCHAIMGSFFMLWSSKKVFNPVHAA